MDASLSLKMVTKQQAPKNTSEMPAGLVIGTQVLAQFRESGLLNDVAKLGLGRKFGSHDAVGLFALAVSFFMAGPEWGIRSFLEKFRGALGRVAVIAGLRRLPSQSSVSRALQAITAEQAIAFADGTLMRAAGADALLAHPSVAHWDSMGKPWHVVDFDPTVQAFRQRSLPEGMAAPPPQRRAQGKPGYTGQRRGEIRVRHLPLIHAGAGLWLAYRLDSEGLPGVHALGQVLTAARPTLESLGLGQVIVRMDGEFGNVGGLRVCQKQGLHMVSRLSRYQILERPEVKAQLRDAVWWPVPSPDSCKPTEAADLGLVTLHPAAQAVDAAEGPVDVRLVVTRLRPSGEAAHHGVLVDGYQLELFVTSLSGDAWPADELVALYRGRAVIENRFAQEDREFALDRTFSYHPPGQAWFSAVALLLWNHLTCMDFLRNPPPSTPPTQLPRPRLSARETAPGDPLPIDPLPIEGASTPIGQTLPFAPGSTKAPAFDPAADALRRVTQVSAGLLWKYFTGLPDRPGWRFDPVTGVVNCPSHKEFLLFSTDQLPSKTATNPEPRHRILLRNHRGDCDGCPLRATCFSSIQTNTYKRLSITVPAEVALEIEATLRRNRALARSPRTVTLRRPTASTQRSTLPKSILHPLPDMAPGPLVALAPSFLPSEARRRARRRFARSIRVQFIQTRPRRDKRHPLVQPHRDRRQHQRRSWADRDLFSACKAQVTMTLDRQSVWPKDHQPRY